MDRRKRSETHTTGGKLGTGIKRVQAVLVVFLLASIGFIGIQPAVATELEPGPGSETGQPTETATPTPPVVPPVVVPPILEPSPTPPPLEPEKTPEPAPPAVEPAPVAPPVNEPVAPPAVETVAPTAPTQETLLPNLPRDGEVQGYVDQPLVPEEPTTAPAESTPSPTPTPMPTKSAAPPVASADIAGPLKVALAPVAENNPLVQGVTILVLILLGVAYFRALRSKGSPRPRLNGK
ncbi:outer membrane biosynthesis protein TonB [Paenarthrobacter sp. 4246]